MRKALVIAATAGVAAVAAAVWLSLVHGNPDYRDPVQLARAMKDTHHGATASCVKMPTASYLCTVAAADGSIGTYTVHVSADGSTYQAA